MIYKIRVILNTEEDVFRDIEIKYNQTLGKLHEAIKSAFSLQGQEMSSFYLSDDNWNQGKEIPLEDMTDNGSGETMYDIYIKEVFISEKSKLLYIYDYLILWNFYVEVLSISNKDLKLNYPLTVYRFGKVPNKVFSTPSDFFMEQENILLTNEEIEELDFEELENFDDD